MRIAVRLSERPFLEVGSERLRYCPLEGKALTVAISVATLPHIVQPRGRTRQTSAIKESLYYRLRALRQSLTPQGLQQLRANHIPTQLHHFPK